MNRKKAKIIVNAVGIALLIGAGVGFLLPYVLVRVGYTGNADYLGWQLALNFDGFPQNLGTLFPLIFVVVGLVYGVIALIKKIKGLKAEPKEGKGGLKMLVGGLFVICGIINLFLCLASVDIAAPYQNTAYAGHYLGIGAYLTAYFSLIGGLVMFVSESGIIKD